MADGNKDDRPALRTDSTLARNFSDQLDGVFNLGGLEELSQNVTAKQQQISSQSRELEELEARIRAAEEALRARTAGRATAGPGSGPGHAQPQHRDVRDIFPDRGPGQQTQTQTQGAQLRTAAGSSVADRVPTPLNPGTRRG